MCLSKYSYIVSTGVFRYLVHVPAAEILHSGVCVAAFMLVILTVVIAVVVVAPTSVVGDTVAAKNVAAGEMKSVRYACSLQNFDEFNQNHLTRPSVTL